MKKLQRETVESKFLKMLISQIFRLPCQLYGEGPRDAGPLRVPEPEVGEEGLAPVVSGIDI